MAQAPLFPCTKCGVPKPHDTEHFTTKLAYVRKREWGKLPTTVCRNCKRKQVQETMKKKWADKREFEQVRDQERTSEMVKAMEASAAPPAPEPMPGPTLEERRAKPFDMSWIDVDGLKKE